MPAQNAHGQEFEPWATSGVASWADTSVLKEGQRVAVKAHGGTSGVYHGRRFVTPGYSADLKKIARSGHAAYIECETSSGRTVLMRIDAKRFG